MARCWLDLHDPDKTVFLAGVGRSGTTWLGDVMNYRNTFRMMFEPFYPVRVPELKPFWKPQQYLRSEAAGPGPEMARRILAGRIRNDWVDQFNSRKVATRRLIKEVRFNLSLAWAHRAFPKIPIVFLLRHPIPTALSQLKLEWALTAKLFLDQSELMADWLEPYRQEMEETRDPFEAQILIWCLMNWVPLRQFSKGGLHVVFYETLCRQPESILPALFERIGVEDADDVLPLLKRPSALTHPFSAITRGKDPVESWREQVTPSQQAAAMAILKRFGLDRLYGEDGMPRVRGESALSLFLNAG